MRANATSRWPIAVALAAVVFVCFSPALRNGFVGYDDPDYVTRNGHVTGGLSWPMVKWAFNTMHASNWHPLTWISHALDCSLFSLVPAGHHLTSLLLHAANAALLFLWLSGATATRWRSAFVALVFGLHPLHVESVAWIAERKDVLCGFFLILTLLAYSAYAKAPSAGRYTLVIATFVAALLSKPMAITLPVLLLVIDRWPLERKEPWRKLIAEKIPLLALSAFSAAATLWAQFVSGSVSAVAVLPLSLRIENAIVSYGAYIVKMLWPVNLAAFYPFPTHGIAAWKLVASSIALAVISWIAWRMRGERPWLIAGWIWYLVALVPVIGILQVGMQAVADRYMYLPMIGLLMAIAWELPRRRTARVAAVIALTACTALSWRQISYWKDGVTLWTHAIDVTHDNFIAHDNLGVELDALGRPDEALEQYRETLRIEPGDRNGESNFAQASFAKGQRLLQAGQDTEAVAAYQDGLRYRPGNPLAHMQLGVALARVGRIAEAEGQLRLSVQIDPSVAEAHFDLGAVEAALGKREAALAEFEAALRVNPNDASARAARDSLLRH